MKAFARSAHLTFQNFSSQPHRAFIMDKIFEASNFNDEDIINSTLESLNDICRVSYDYIREYIDKIGQLTSSLIASEYESAAKLAIEVWATIAEVEFNRMS